MSKNVRKTLKLLKLSQPNPGWKKGSSHPASDEAKKSNKFKGLRKLFPKMGNFTSTNRQQHIIENVDEHATRVMARLTEFREEGLGCDLILSNNETKPAHKIVVSFNQNLLDIVESTTTTVTVTIEEEDNEVDQIVCDTDCLKDKIDNAEANDISTSPSESCDVVTMEQETDGDEQGLVAMLPINDVSSHYETLSEEKVNDLDLHSSDSVSDENKVEDSVSTEKDKEETVVSEDLSPPLFSEVALTVEEDEAKDDEEERTISSSETESKMEKENQVEDDSYCQDNKYEEAMSDSNKKSAYLNDEGFCSRDSSDNPPEYSAAIDASCFTEQGSIPNTNENSINILINFLYTSHIDITKKNVTELRILANQCGLEDVVTACDEFNKVLFTETEYLMTDAEKDDVASKFHYRYSDPSLPLNMLHHFESMLKQKRFTDLNLRSTNDEKCFDVHSVVVAAGSTFFKPTFKNEKPEEKEISEIQANILEQMISFLYCGKVEVTPETVSELIDAARLLKMDDVIEGCAEFLEIITTLHNCIQHRKIAYEYNCEKLKTLTNKLISSNFLSISNQSDFMCLSSDELISISSMNDLSLSIPLAKGEIEVYDAIKRWIDHDEDNRKEKLSTVMSAVRFPLMDPENIVKNVSTDLLIMSNPETSKRLTDIITSSPLMSFSEPVSMRGEECLLIAGGSFPIEDVTCEERGYQAVHYSNQFTMYDHVNAKFHELAVLPETRALHCVAACDQYVFVVGGFDPHSCMVDTVYCFDLATGKWSLLPSLKIKRSCFSLHSVPGYLFAVGGLTPKGFTASVECLDRKRKVWESAAPLPESRYRHAGCVLNGRILVTGGNEKSDSVMSYDVESKKWKKEVPMNIGRNSHAVVTVNEAAYAIGGEDIDFSAECYRDNSWTMLAHPVFCSKLYFPGCSVIENQIYVCGGWVEEDDPFRNIWIYDTTTHLWLASSHHMVLPRGSAGTCTIRIPKNYWKIKFTSHSAKPLNVTIVSD